ncbi:RrF2 family transcriptional regulator [Peptoniphilus sp.]|uniref:RrF2 family transcriptional regulator n=1 Tax=Peptoniphilus sp. TaxID=1971214 RepID=UPI0039931471
MKLSTKGRYGLMAMYRLMESYGDGPQSINNIAEKENLSDSYLEQLFSLLKNAKLVKSTRGVNGGYSLARDPKDIKIGEIIEALEGNMELSCCQKDVVCPKSEECPTRDILDEVQFKIESVLDSMTLEDMKK